ncbi:MAG: MBL fold metallo-hydrolase [Gemmatimonadota bacterium]|nr:MBL fold metallo-hydrolase [Gemmatimonadota bacterium]
MSDLLTDVTWFRGSSIRIRRAGVEIHVDPLALPASGDESKADFILLTHPHYDNFSEEGIHRVRKAGTVIIAPATMKKQLADADHFMRPGDMLQLDGLDVLAVPAHNEEKKFHTPEDGWLGYVFTIGEVTYYHAGDTDFLPSMFGIRCDVAFLPCDGHYTMGPMEAARAASACGASVMVPIHWGDSHCTREDLDEIQYQFSGEVRVLERTA